MNDTERIEILTATLKAYAHRENWSSSRDSLFLGVFNPGFISSRLTGQDRSGMENGGWEPAEHALRVTGV